MRVLLSTIGSRGDVEPLVALALQLRAHGEDVRLCVPPDFVEWIETFGLPVTPIGPELRTMAAPFAPSAPPTPEQLRQMAEATVVTQFETVAGAARDCDIIVAATALQIAARSVAEAMGIPYVFAAYCPAVLPSPHHPPPPLPGMPADGADNQELWARNAARFAATFGAPLNAHRDRLGLPSVCDVRGHVFGPRPWLAADATLAPWPDPADETVFQSGAWILPDERPLSPEVEAFLDAGEPPVYIGFGSMHVPQELARTLLDSARALGRRAILSSGWAGLSLAGDETDRIVIGEANLQRLFTRVAAVVHHGGAGTTTTAARAGVPQVIMPRMYDQHYWAQRVGQLGIGAATLEGALQPAVAARARAVAGAVRTDGAELAARQVIALARQ